MDIDLMSDTSLAGYPCAYFAPTYKMLGEVWREVSALFRPVSTRVSVQDHRIDLLTGGSIEMWSLDSPDAPRGRKYRRALVDEAAMVAGLKDAWEKSIRPTLADLEGDAWFNSTPRGLNYFYELFDRGQRGMDNWRSWRFHTSSNPYIKASEIAAMRAEMPQRVYEQEVEAAFVEDGSYFRNVNACAVIDEPDKPEQHAGHDVVGGLDWGNQEDFTVDTMFCRQCARVMDWDRSNQIGYEHQRARVKVMFDRWRPTGILPERNSIGLPLTENLASDGIPILNGPDNAPGFNTLPTTKPMLIQALALAIERKEIQIPREYAAELMAYELKTTQAGKQTWSAPTGQHDDRVISLALAYYAASNVALQMWL